MDGKGRHIERNDSSKLKTHRRSLTGKWNKTREGGEKKPFKHKGEAIPIKDQITYRNCEGLEKTIKKEVSGEK